MGQRENSYPKTNCHDFNDLCTGLLEWFFLSSVVPIDDRYSIAACSLSLIATPWVKERFRIRKQNVVTWPLVSKTYSSCHGYHPAFRCLRIDLSRSLSWLSFKMLGKLFMFLFRSHLPFFGNHLHFLSVTLQPWEDRPAFNPVEDSNQSH